MGKRERGGGLRGIKENKWKEEAHIQIMRGGRGEMMHKETDCDGGLGGHWGGHENRVKTV